MSDERWLLRKHRMVEAGMAPYEATIERYDERDNPDIRRRIVARVFCEDAADRIMKMRRVDRALLIAARALKVVLENAKHLSDGHVAGVKHALEVLQDCGVDLDLEGI